MRGIRLLVDTGLMAEFLPEIPALRLEVDEHHHHKDVYEHSLTVLRQAIELEQARHPDAAPDVPLRLAALLHDIGKPSTRKLEPGGGVTFYHHDLKGARLARKRLQALRFDSDTTDVVTRLIELHLRFFGYAEGAWTDSAVRRVLASHSQASQTARAAANGSSESRSSKLAQHHRHQHRRLRRRGPGAALAAAAGALLVGGHERPVRRARRSQLAGALVGRVGQPEVDARPADHRGRRRSSASGRSASVAAASPRLIATASVR